MTKKTTRTEGLLLLLTLIVSIGTIVQHYRLGESLARERTAAIGVERDFGAMTLALANYRAAQAGYVATGQMPAAWTQRTTALAADMHATLDRWIAASTTTPARGHYDAAAVALKNIESIDARARAYADSERRFEASDLLFVDSTEPVQRFATEVAEARTAELDARTARMTLTSRIQLAIVAGAVLFAFAVTLFFGRARSRAAAAEAATAASELARESPARLIVPAASPVPSASVSAQSVAGPHLPEAAELCTDLARVMDGADVPALLERAVGVLRAKGAVLWVADSSGAVLRPSFASGYPEKVLAKMSALQIDADNVTSLAFRSMRAQVVSGSSPTTRGAIAVPLVTSSGCVGVLSAEVSQSQPSPDTLAVARIIAAQVAALVGPADSASASSPAVSYR